jgi:hypothetical protein
MSAFRNNQTNMRDTECLEGALKDVGCKPEIHKAPQHLYGYQGDKRSQTAEIIIPRKTISSVSNDIGFKKQTDGSYLAIISEYDTNEYGPKWLEKVQKAYGVRKVKKMADDLGLEFEEKRDLKSGQVQLQYAQVGR